MKIEESSILHADGDEIIWVFTTNGNRHAAIIYDYLTGYFYVNINPLNNRYITINIIKEQIGLNIDIVEIYSRITTIINKVPGELVDMLLTTKGY